VSSEWFLPPEFPPAKLLQNGSEHELGFLVARGFIENKKNSGQELRETLRSIPILNALPTSSWPIFLRRAEAANLISKELESEFFSTVAASLIGEGALSRRWNLERTLIFAKAGLSEINQLKVTEVLEYFLHFPNYVSLGHRWSEAEYLAAAARLGCEFLAHWYASNSHNESAGKNLYLWILYEATIHDLLIGVKTNCSLFAEFPREVPLSILNFSRVICQAANEEELKEIQVRNLFSGAPVSSIYRTDSGSFFIS